MNDRLFFTNSQSVIELVRYPVYHSKTKHKRRYHFTCRLVEDGDVFGEDRGCNESIKHVDKMC